MNRRDDLFAGQAHVIDTAKVRTLPGLYSALARMMAIAADRGTRAVDLANIHPRDGAVVSLLCDADGRFFIAFDGLRP